MTKKKKKKGAQATLPMSPERYIRERIRLLPIDRCLVSQGWKDSGLAVVVVTRRHPKGSITAGIYLVDTFCRGVCNSHCFFSIAEDELDDILARYSRGVSFEEASYEEAHNLVFGAIAFAEEAGIAPCEDFKLTQYILEDDTDDIPLIEYEYGREGKYFLCVPSQLEASRYLPALRAHLGDDFDFMINEEEVDDEYDDEEESDYLDDGTPSILDLPQGIEGEYSYQHGEYKQTEELHYPWLQALLSNPDKEILSHEEIDKLLALPHDELRHDLRQLALAEMGRNARGEYSEPYNPLISHVFILLGEVGDDDSLELLLEMLRQDKDFFEYHICDGGGEIVQPALYKLAKGCTRRLVDFLEEPGLYNFARIHVLETVLPQMVYLESERREEAVCYARELTAFLLSHNGDTSYVDGALAGFLCAGIMDIGAEELLPQIERIYATGYVDESICGTLDTVKRDFKDTYGDNPLILDIHELYDKMKRLYKRD